MSSIELIRKMKQRAEAVQALVAVIGSFEEAGRYAVEVTRSGGGKTIAAPNLKPAEREMLREECRSAGLTLLTDSLGSAAEPIHTALTTADWGLAETGTLVLDSRSEDLRIATMLSDIHVAVLPSGRIKPDSEALEPILNDSLKSDLPSYLAFITGASRTADIERVLAIGVHGPKELHILIEDRRRK